jgi:hypothetical protein
VTTAVLVDFIDASLTRTGQVATSRRQLAIEC